MGTRFVAYLATAIILTAAIAYADDYGPHRDLRAIRGALPILHRAELKDGPLVIDSVVVVRDNALAQWSAGTTTRIDLLRFRYDRWWLERQMGSGQSVDYQGCGEHGATPSFLLANGVASDLVAAAAQHVPLVSSAAAQPTPTPPPTPDPSGGRLLVKDPCWSGEIYRLDRMPFGAQFTTISGGFWMRGKFAASDAASGAALDPLAMRRPTEAESWIVPGGNSEFFFSATVQSTNPIHVQDGTTLDVWFPFVLDDHLRYSLTIAHTDVPVGPILGTLKDNTLHFVLPAFSMKPGSHLMGEIEYLPPRRN